MIAKVIGTLDTIGTLATGAWMPEKDPQELRRQVEADEWLRAGDVAIVLGLSRSTVHRLLASGEIGWKLRPGGKQRRCDPADVLRLLRDADSLRRGEMT